MDNKMIPLEFNIHDDRRATLVFWRDISKELSMEHISVLRNKAVTIEC